MGVCAGGACGLSGLQPGRVSLPLGPPHADPLRRDIPPLLSPLAFMAPCKSLSSNTSLSALLELLSFQHIYPRGGIQRRRCGREVVRGGGGGRGGPTRLEID